jgi:uncharacterized membrane protein YeaQ/YmgE (transglycosylase-associated protein family)
MLDMGLVGWIVVGFIAGSLSGMVVSNRSARGCLPNILIGVLGGLLGGFLARELRFGDAQGFLGAVLVAFLGAVLVRFVIGSLESPRRR